MTDIIKRLEDIYNEIIALRDEQSKPAKNGFHVINGSNYNIDALDAAIEDIGDALNALMDSKR